MPDLRLIVRPPGTACTYTLRPYHFGDSTSSPLEMLTRDAIDAVEKEADVPAQGVLMSTDDGSLSVGIWAPEKDGWAIALQVMSIR
jgi:hypothetical protein